MNLDLISIQSNFFVPNIYYVSLWLKCCVRASMYVCMYVCMYVVFRSWSYPRALCRLLCPFSIVRFFSQKVDIRYQ